MVQPKSYLVENGQMKMSRRVEHLPPYLFVEITKKITELVTTGRLGYYERLKAELAEKTNTAKG